MIRRTIDIVLVAGFLTVAAILAAPLFSRRTVDALVVTRFYDYRYDPPRLTIGTDAGVFEFAGADAVTIGGRYRLTIQNHSWPTQGRPMVVQYSPTGAAND